MSSQECALLQSIFPSLGIQDSCCNINKDTVITRCDGGRLVGLFITSNDVTGSFPNDVFRFDQLRELSLRCKYTGAIPDSFDRLPKLTAIAVQSPVSGSIPVSIGQLKSLKSLLFEDTYLGSEIPTWLGQLTTLEQLYLVRSQLRGQIPQEVANLPGLQQLVLAGNMLSGQIPDFKSNANNGAGVGYSDFNSNYFSGSLPKKVVINNIGNNCFQQDAVRSLGNKLSFTFLFLLLGKKTDHYLSNENSVEKTQRSESDCNAFLNPQQPKPSDPPSPSQDPSATPSASDATVPSLTSTDSTTTSRLDVLTSGSVSPTETTPRSSNQSPTAQPSTQNGVKSASENDTSSSNKPVIIGIVVGLVTLIIIAALLAFWFKSRKQRREREKSLVVGSSDRYRNLEESSTSSQSIPLVPVQYQNATSTKVALSPPTSASSSEMRNEPVPANAGVSLYPNEKASLFNAPPQHAHITDRTFQHRDDSNIVSQQISPNYTVFKSPIDSHQTPSTPDYISTPFSTPSSSSKASYNPSSYNPSTMSSSMASGSSSKAEYVRQQDFSSHPQAWSAETVSSWLRSNGVSETIVGLFFRENVDGSRLLHLDAAGMSALGMGLSEDTIHFSTQLKILRESWGMSAPKGAELPQYSF
ncbi:hypothetical protein HDU97_001015 [Phlyctochytrium planicorne]|nr:hypothetical protein HDU97_001015 [Phlyctochytrium planicorne]